MSKQEPTNTLPNAEWIESKLSSLEFVEWDRFTTGEWNGLCVSVYGWIDRPDDHEDFVLVIFWPEEEELYFTTSAADYSTEIYQHLVGVNPGEHDRCHRVEDAFDIPNSIGLDDADDDRTASEDPTTMFLVSKRLAGNSNNGFLPVEVFRSRSNAVDASKDHDDLLVNRLNVGDI